MKLLIGIIIGFLLATSLSFGELIVNGKKTVYMGNALESGITVTEGETAPTNPATGDLFRNIQDGTIYTWNGSIWVVNNLKQDIKDEIQIFKDNIELVTDPKAKKCLKSLEKIILRLYKEE